jgi:hypothetical protein
MKESECIEVLEDGTIYHFDIDVSNQAADEALEKLYEKEGKELKFDYTAAVFSLFVSAIHTLTVSGWSTEDLIAEVIDHSDADDRENFMCDCQQDDDED